MIEKVEPALGHANTESPKPKHAGGRPRKLTAEQQQEVYEALEQYIKQEKDPTIVGFVSEDETAIQYDVTDDNINDWPEFSRLRKAAVKKQEAYLVREGTRNSINVTMAIFRLKQPVFGYTDRQQVENSGEQKLIIETRKHKANRDNGDGNADD